MKKLSLILILISLISCNNKSNKKNLSIIGKESKSRNFKDIELLKGYLKISDTTLFEGSIEDKYGILHLKKESNHLIIFKDITTDSNENYTYKILDTLSISNLKHTESVSIGYCSLKHNNNENIIAIVDKTITDRLKIGGIKQVWKANTTSKKIEQIVNTDEVTCFNEFYEE